jgi:GT2 family glycosyltransferase
MASSLGPGESDASSGAVEVNGKESDTSAFLPDLEVDPVRPGEPGDVATPERLAEVQAKLPARPAFDGAAEVSYVLGSYNRHDLLRRAVDSIRADCSGLSHEIIIVDGGSTDGSIEWICAQDDVIGIIQHNRYVKDGLTRRRMSWGRFMNIGFRAAGAPWVAMISDDCYLLSGSTRAALKHVAAASEAGVKVGACAYYFRNWPQDTHYYVQRTLGGNLMVNHGLYARQALVDVGYANEIDYAFYKADTDLSLKIWAAGYAIIDCKDAICEHFMTPGEETRASNDAMVHHDRRMMHVKWPGISRWELTPKIGRVVSDRTDSAQTAERVFGDLQAKS